MIAVFVPRSAIFFPFLIICADVEKSKMAADVPLLTQDDFLSHLKLQPVTSKAAFAYRHALKER